MSNAQQPKPATSASDANRPAKGKTGDIKGVIVDRSSNVTFVNKTDFILVITDAEIISGTWDTPDGHGPPKFIEAGTECLVILNDNPGAQSSPISPCLLTQL